MSPAGLLVPYTPPGFCTSPFYRVIIALLLMDPSATVAFSPTKSGAVPTMRTALLAVRNAFRGNHIDKLMARLATDFKACQ